MGGGEPVSHRVVTGAIMAGGANTRFGGAAKGLARVGGARIIDRVASALRGVTSRLVLVANDPDADSWLPGATVRHDARPERGSIVGIHTAISAATDGIALVVAWDMPFVSESLLRLIAERVLNGAAAVVPESDDGLEPFCAAYSPACLPVVERAIERGEFRMSSLVARLPGLQVVDLETVRSFGDPQRIFFNVNAAADLEAAERMAAS